jgi:hypothetical protein
MPENFTIPTTINKFNQLGGLPEPWVIGQLRQVAAGTKSIDQFYAACMDLKTFMKVKSWIIGIVRVRGTKLTADEMRLASDEEVAELYPVTCSDNFRESLLPGSMTRPASAGPTSEISRAVSQWMKVDEAVNVQVHFHA